MTISRDGLEFLADFADANPDRASRILLAALTAFASHSSPDDPARECTKALIEAIDAALVVAGAPGLWQREEQ